MPWRRGPVSAKIFLLADYYSNAAITAAPNKAERTAPAPCRIVAIEARAEGAGVGAGSSTIDINKNGTTIFTTQANRPTIATASTGELTILSPDGETSLNAGDRISIDVDAIPATTGHTRVSVSVWAELA
jgi:hypothetical protein